MAPNQDRGRDASHPDDGAADAGRGDDVHARPAPAPEPHAGGGRGPDWAAFVRHRDSPGRSDSRARLLNAVRQALPDAAPQDLIDALQTAVAVEPPPGAGGGGKGAWPPDEYFRLMFQASGVGIALLDFEGVPIRCNPALERMLGQSEDELRQAPFAGLAHAEDGDHGSVLYGEVAAGFRSEFELEQRFRHKDGHVVPAHVTVARVPGHPPHAIAVVQDLSEAQRGNADRQRLFHALAERVKEMTTVRAAVRVLHDESLALEPLLQALAATIPPGFEAPGLAAACIRCEGLAVATAGYTETAWKLQTTFALRSGGSGSIEVVYVRERPGSPRNAFLPEERALLETLASMLAVTLDRRRTENQLKLAVGAGGTAVWEWDLATGRISWPGRVDSPDAPAPWGVCASLAGCMALVHPEDRGLIEALAHSVSERPADRGHLETELRVVGTDGTLRSILLTGQIFRDTQGRAERVLGVAVDMTERRSLELQLRQSQKLESIGMLAGGVAHDFNNMLSVILGYGQMLQVQLGADHPAAPRLGEIVAAGERAAKLTRQLLAFSRRQVMSPTLLDLNAVVCSLEGMLRRLIRENIELAFHLPSTLGTVLVDAGQIEQVVVNLVINASDAMPKGGTLVLSTADVEVREPRDLQGGRIEPGRWVVLSVEDSGVGMDPTTQAHLFEPFFTTKASGRGTGLGLATVHGIVRQSGGQVTFTSEVGRGSSFHVHLPRVEGAPAKAAARVCDRGAVRGSGTVLLVEDQEAVRQFAQAALEAKGYHVLVANDAEHAERLALASAVPIDLLLTDVVMPGASGTQLATKLSARHPGLRVVLMSGYARDGAAGTGLLQPGQTLLEKPLTFEGLAQAVRDALQSRPDPGPSPDASPR